MCKNTYKIVFLNNNPINSTTRSLRGRNEAIFDSIKSFLQSYFTLNLNEELPNSP